jgi:hypothetical protein
MRGWLAVGVVAAIALYVIQPPGTVPVASTPTEWPAAARGAVHVHSRRSDGSGTVDQIAAEAARAGLDFVILTDHGDGVREPEPPVYRSGVLCIDAVEIGSDGGHIVALGLPATPYPLGGSPADVVEDIARLGGFSIAAHPESPKADMRWSDWALPVDGIEWLNGDSEWRDESFAALGRVLVTFPFAGARALGLALDRPDATLRHWDQLLGTRRVVALAAADAHARLGSDESGVTRGAAIQAPAYHRVFELLSVTISPVTLTRNAKADAGAILTAIREGRVYSSIDALAAPAHLVFRGMVGAQEIPMGGVIDPPAAVTLEVATNAPADHQITLFRDGSPVTMSNAQQLQFEAPAMPAVYRVEIGVAGAPGTPPVPWIVSNPIYVGPRGAATPPLADTARPAGAPVVRYPGTAVTDWTVETSPRSKAEVGEALTARGRQIALRWALGGTRSESPFAAAVVPVGPSLAANGRLLLTARASKPTRVSVQLRAPDGGAGERWRRSVYLDIDPREIAIPFDAMTPVGAAGEHPPLDRVRDLLIVIDMVNASLGSNGQVWIERVAYSP